MKGIARWLRLGENGIAAAIEDVGKHAPYIIIHHLLLT